MKLWLLQTEECDDLSITLVTFDPPRSDKVNFSRTMQTVVFAYTEHSSDSQIQVSHEDRLQHDVQESIKPGTEFSNESEPREERNILLIKQT